MRRPFSPIARALALGAICAACFAALLGATGAIAQDPTATPEPTLSPAAATPTPAEPSLPAPVAPTPAPEPVVAEATPDVAPQPPAATLEPAAVEPAPQAVPAPRPQTAPRDCSETAEAIAGTRGAGLAGSEPSAIQPAPGASTSPRRCAKPVPVSPDPEPTRAPRPASTPAPTATPANGDPSDPSLSGPSAPAAPGPVRTRVPNFFIEKFRIPPFLLSIYQAAGIQYGIRWELLAAINEIETDYGRNLNVSSAGALGWMQFMPATWKAYGVDANHDGAKDPYNPVDAIFASARYLRAAGGHTDVRRAVFAYNHANWYVDSVLARARLVGALPPDFIGSLTGLTEGRFPVDARTTYVKSGKPRERKGTDLFAHRNARVVAVNDGRILRVGSTTRLGRFVRLQDVYGNTYTYGRLGRVARNYPAPRRRHVSQAAVRRELKLPRDSRPTRAASTRPRHPPRRSARVEIGSRPARAVAKERLFAHPSRPAARRAGGVRQLDTRPSSERLRFDPERFEAKPLRRGARVLAGTVLGRVGRAHAGKVSHVRFEIRPAGRGAPRVDPKPMLDGWKLLESSAIYRAERRNPFFGDEAGRPSIGQILLMGKDELQRRVLANPDIELYACGREDVSSGQIDRRVLAALEYLAASGLKPTVTSLRCGHGIRTSSGNVSEHSTGDAVDIAAINGVPIVGHQGRNSVTEETIQRLLSLQGAMEPHQIISLMTFEGADNTFAMSDHADHIHLGWRPLYSSSGRAARRVSAILEPEQWTKLIDRLSRIGNPAVRLTPSRFSVKVVKRAANSR